MALYQSLEEAYYNAVDSINKIIPVRKVTDPIDKVVPSMIVFLLIILAVVALIALQFIPSGALGQSNVFLTFEDSQGQPLQGVQVKATFNNSTQEFSSNEKGEVSFTVPFGSQIKIEGTKKNFESILRSIEANKDSLKLSIPLISLASSAKKRITLAKPDGSLLQEPASISFGCSNAFSESPEAITTSIGTFEVTPSNECGDLLVDVESQSYKTLSSRRVLGNDTIFLSEFDSPKGKAEVFVTDETGNDLDGIEVSLFDSFGSLIESKNSVQGLVVFEDLLIGEYFVSGNDFSGQYAIERSSSSLVQKNRGTTFTLRMSKAVKGILTVNLSDSKSNAIVSNARISLTKEGALTPLFTISSDLQGKAEFSLIDSGKYFLAVSHDDYLLEQKEISFTSGDLSVPIALEKLSPENSGRVIVSVKDEDGARVENAKIFVFNAETNLLVPVEAKITDANGETEFNGLSEGNYFFKAIKDLVKADSEPLQVRLRLVNRATVNLIRGTGTIEVEAKDVDGSNVSFSEIEVIFLGENRSEKTLTDEEGKALLPLKGGSQVYLRVTKEGFLPFRSQTIRVFDAQNVKVKAEMQVQIPGRNPGIEFLGLFEDESVSQPVQEIESGTNYIARLQLKIPSQANYRRLGVHVRTGQTELLQKDNIFIKDVLAPNSSIIRGTSFNSPSSEALDKSNITFGDAKWANILFNDLRPGIYNIDVEVRVKGEIVPGDIAPIYFRAWGETAQGEILRDPLDSVLGTARTGDAKQELYAQANEKIFYEGQPAACDEDFCYAAERILDLDERIYARQPYAIALFGKHKLSLEITNNSQAVHDKAEIRIKNFTEGKLVDDALTITSYKFTNADSQTFERSNIEVNQLPPLKLGRFTQNKNLLLEMDFTPRKVAGTSFLLQIVSEGNIVFEKFIQISVLADKPFQYTLMPELIPPFIEQEMNLRLTEESGLAVPNAKLELFKVLPSGTKVRASSYTSNENGRILFKVPSSLPNDKYFLKASKRGFKSLDLDLLVDPKIVSFNPETLSTKVQSLGLSEDTALVSITNLIKPQLKIKEIDVLGYFKGLLNESSMEEYLDQFKGTPLEQNRERDFPFFRVALNEGALVDRQQTLSGELQVFMENEELRKTWSFKIPFNVLVEVGAGVSEENCLIVEGINVPEWKTISEGETVATDVQIVNRCLSSGRAVQLRNLKANINWKSNAIGNVELAIRNLETGESLQETLKQGLSVPFFGAISADETLYQGTIYFTPKPG
ncbi:MAG TPA: carboxypeptidase-like regulatory domain-containing protein, partial [archaeon]|nr:carboxypeptidase-like regulatory domain-containing protein [archaeon]